MKHITKHLPHYLPLLGLLVVSFLGFFFFRYDRVFQMGVAIALAVAYVAWGLVHHYLHRDLYLSVIIEYIAIACLGLVIVFSIVFQS